MILKFLKSMNSVKVSDPDFDSTYIQQKKMTSKITLIQDSCKKKKIAKRCKKNNSQSLALFNNELKITKQIYPNQIEEYHPSHEKIMVMPHFGTSLFDLIIYEGPFNKKPKVAQKILYGAITALVNFHNLGFIHGDIKPSNIVLDKNYNAKLIDFEFSYENHTKNTHSFGTYGYIAPEVIRCDYKTSKIDVFSFGVTMFSVLTGFEIFKEKEYQKYAYWGQKKFSSVIIRRIIKKVELSQYAHVMVKCLEYDPKSRLRSSEVKVKLKNFF